MLKNMHEQIFINPFVHVRYSILVSKKKTH